MLQMPKRSLCDLVLDTIDIISARKNRPNLVRIYRHLHRLYDLSLSTCESLLQSLLKEGRVIRVTYKGNISYRNALKWKKYSYYMKKTMGSELPGTILTKAISELVVQEPDYLNMGVPCNILEEHLLSMKDDNINKETIHKLLQRELKHESLLQLDNGNYFLGPKPPETPMFDNEEVDLKFEKVKKVKTYKHEIKRLKDRTIETINSSSLLLQNNNISELSKDLSDSEELNTSNVKTGIECIKHEGLERHTELGDNENCDATMENNLCNPIIIKVEGNSKHFEDCGASDFENGNIVILDEEDTENESLLERKETNGKVSFRPLEELVGTESSSSQVIDSEDSVLNVNGKCSIDKECSNSPIGEDDDEEDLSLEGSDDSFSLSISEVDSNFNSSKRIIPNYKNNMDKNKKTVENESKSNNSQQDIEVSIGITSVSKPESSPFKVDSDSNEQKNCISGDKVKNKDKTVQPVVERVKRKKRTKYDASDYYFPSLKRKTRESSDNDKKEDKRRKKRKKDNGVGCLSGIFAKRVMFPGNTSMCCECNCYISKVKLDPMIFCTSCANQGHQSCALKTMNGKNWYCVSCRSEAVSRRCTTCSKPADDDRGVLHSCSECGESYHKDCHSLSIKVPFSDKWCCFKCSVVEASSNETSNLSEKNKEKNDSEIQESCDLKNENETKNTFQFLKEEPPDSRNWSSEDVYNYFKEYLDEKAAKAFVEQDIDGYALKLMGRNDVLNLGLKLGPSLKVLFHVRRLQLRSNSLVEIWNN